MVDGMSITAPAPLSATLRFALHLLIAGLTGFLIIREALIGDTAGIVAVLLAIVFLVTYAAGALWLRRTGQLTMAAPWLALLTLLVLALVWISPNAAYLVFPLFFLYLAFLPRWWGVAAVAGCTLLTLVIFGIDGRLTTAGVIGPVVGATVAVAIGLGYRALLRENQERKRLIDELLATREELARTEREAGVLAERARLAREIHDTVAQGLSSIQLLLHAAERDDPGRPGLEHIQLARETAAANLAETRRFIRELTPAALDNQTLAGALERLATSIGQTNRQLADADRDQQSPVEITVRVEGTPVPLPMTIEATLLRVAQGSLANVAQHAAARRVIMTLTYMEGSVSLDIVDDGIGFDPAIGLSGANGRSGASFGLVAMRERVEQLGGAITIESRPGAGTAVAVTFGREP